MSLCAGAPVDRLRAMKLATGVAVAGMLVVALSGCGGSSEGSTAAPDPATTPASAPALTMTDVCPKVEAALPNAMIPSRGQVSAFRAQLSELSRESDLETQNAIELLAAGADTLTKAWTGQIDDPLPMIEGSRAWDNGISDFADRCRAAGSSALQ